MDVQKPMKMTPNSGSGMIRSKTLCPMQKLLLLMKKCQKMMKVLTLKIPPYKPLISHNEGLEVVETTIQNFEQQGVSVIDLLFLRHFHEERNFYCRVNCSFYFKIGACRHGDRCSRIHNKPTFSQTVLLQNLYHNPQNSAQSADGSHCKFLTNLTEEEVQEHFDNFFEDVFVELEDKYGEIEEMNVCDNLGDHLVGNVYVKFRREEDAEKAVEDLNKRWFAGRPIYAELSPVTDFREACCRQYEMGECTRSGFCNFMHLKPISRELRRELYGRHRRRRSRSRSPRSRSRERKRSRSRDRRRRSRSRDREKDRDRREREGRF
ncbi:splicing factor U2AF 26 kDa subunit-like [Stegodyphus dumicola]|uniref:splicing factor U2AF 26 kDa subunit-like n=1 Tax=Stegodyphus dumicola TaxID=202533 RepID=UPI0015AFC138|nr:splicing factor U2AF 26 kDa subunit-like [Stegodyphus dumicola]